MREAKYRAWDKETFALRDVLVIDWLNGLVDLLGGIVERKLDEVALMQYTGLSDKNGVEIYEGDIVKKPYYSDRRRKINGEIKFIDGEFVTDFVDYDQSLRMATDIEVIGNIFYNPELVDSNA